MLFNSFEFLFFFPWVAAIYFYLAPHRRWIWLLAASLYFYMAFLPAYVLFLLLLILIDYAAAQIIESQHGVRRRAALGLSLAANFTFLGLFKYIGLFTAASWWPFLLPLGLSFHTFQSMAYTIEVYRGTQKAERHLGYYALYVMFFPQLVAGPIERPAHLLPQLRQAHSFRYEAAVSGLRLMLWGFVKKLVIADSLAHWVDPVFARPDHFGGLQVLRALVFFSFQIYGDFSGYTDIARGSARLLGFQLVNNFDAPYLARSPIEFWRRWHISLSSWFRDYLYIPLGGSRCRAPQAFLNLLIVFTLSGLWHGANVTFVVWGLYHGLVVALQHGYQRFKGLWNVSDRYAPGPILSTALTFGIITLGWLFFRAETVSDAFTLLRHLTAASSASLADPGWFPWLGIAGLLAVEWLAHNQRDLYQKLVQITWMRWGLYYGAVTAIVAFTAAAPRTFIYFQF